MQSVLLGTYTATVIAQDPKNYAVRVMTKSGFVFPTPVRVLMQGQCDALRAEMFPLPGVGTWGIVSFPDGDMRNAIWLGAIPANQLDAIPSVEATSGQSVRYSSEYSGYWHARDSDGNETFNWPDGSTLVIGTAFQPTKHIADSDGNRVSVAFPNSERRQTPAGPFAFVYTHETGASVSINTSGGILISPASGQNALIGSGTTYRLVDERLVNLFNSHVHSGISTGTSDSGPPTTQMALGSQTTEITKAS